MEKDYIEPAHNECCVHSLKKAKDIIRSYAPDGRIKLGIGIFDDIRIAVWYCISKNGQIVKIPVFRDHAKQQLFGSTIFQIKPGEFFFHDGNVYCYTKGEINRLNCYWNESFIKQMAKAYGIKNPECNLVKCYLIGRIRELVTIQWRIYDEQKDIEFFIPVFSEDKETLLTDSLGFELNINAFDTETAFEGEVFRHQNMLWKLSRNQNGNLFIEKASFQIAL